MKNNQTHLEQIAAYLSGHLSVAERDALDRWVKASKENEQLFNEAKTIWNHSNLKVALPTDETEADWLMLKERIDKEDGEFRMLSWFNSSGMLKIAASIILLIGIAYIFIWPGSDHIRLQAENETEAFYLPDSTHVWLNAHSILEYDDTYGAADRTVRLQGEGYFKVKHNATSPFIVNTKSTQTKVLGTSFTLREDSLATMLIVVDGIVSFAAQKDVTKKITVKAKEKATFKDNRLQKQSNDNARFSHWIKKDNPVHESEVLNPLSHLETSYTWKKNAFNQSVIAGVVKSTATVATYQNVTLQISYVKANGKLKTVHVHIPGTIASGGEIHYRKKLHDILSSTRSITVKVESAEVHATATNK